MANPDISGLKRITFVLPSLTAGGAERVAITLMNNLDPKIYQRTLIVTCDPDTLKDWVADDITVHFLKRKNILLSLPALLKALNAAKPDIVFSTMAAMNFGVLLIKPFLKNKPKLIVREAVIPSSIAQSKDYPWLVKTLYKILYPRADIVLSPARCIIEEFALYLGLGTHNHILLHNPVDIERIRDTRASFPESTPERAKIVRYVCAGRLHKQKGFDRLIRALTKLDHEKPWHLDILGAGPEAGNLKALVKAAGLEKNISLHGLVRKPWPVMAQADAFLLPSRWEGLPNVALESLALGTPVIAMREAGGIDEIAALADPGAVTIVNNMKDFLQSMRLVTPAPAQNYRPSLLPDSFRLAHVMKNLSAVLSDLLTA